MDDRVCEICKEPLHGDPQPKDRCDKHQPEDLLPAAPLGQVWVPAWTVRAIRSKVAALCPDLEGERLKWAVQAALEGFPTEHLENEAHDAICDALSQAGFEMER